MLQPSLPLTYYTVEPHSAEGKIRNRLTSCKTFSSRASELVTDLQSIIDPSVAKSSRIIRTTAVDEGGEGPEDRAGDGNEEDDFFDQTESSDHIVDDGGWESGSVDSQNDDPPTGQYTTSTDSDSEPEFQPGSTLGITSPAISGLKRKTQLKLKPEVVFGEDTEGCTPDSNSDSDAPNPSLHAQKKASKAGTSTFLPSLSVGYIPGTGDSDPEDELEAVEGKAGRKNRRGQRARRA